MATAAWLDRYYGKDADSLNPTVIFDGKKLAVVRITNAGGKVGYVLLKKGGKHNNSKHISLHDGVAKPADFVAMRARLLREDD
jgi:hypothetical protein